MYTNSNEPKLAIELIPKTCHFSSARTMLSSTEWNKIRNITYTKANNKCEICGSNGLKQGFNHALEAHEVWFYDDEKYIQKLIKLESLCVICHRVKHIGRAMAMGKEQIYLKHLARINKWTQQQVHDYVLKSFELHKERSKYQWSLDLSYLTNEPYNIILKENTERIFEIKKYKKKKKKPKVSGEKKKLHPKANLKKALKPKSSTNKKPPKKL